MNEANLFSESFVARIFFTVNGYSLVEHESADDTSAYSHCSPFQLSENWEKILVLSEMKTNVIVREPNTFL